ncbi:terpene cyclase/mutase family protein [Streptomyces sp. DSM 42041]|uniref:Terpene cyclase/mutase family protein n=1 Tax=Streptomyces hazeniae TaxID=3075538 RepID=A0ABU2NMJ9_9ACTN|nr:prenyltransferase/squalene oxidase repeat-containing protein [Streptomyces sp. DSM 42041]MDT0378209.1 terpene cyclase/mutase family protein [Streptomyces sp. DSM 42041]
MQDDGRFRDAPLDEDISNQFTQSLAVLALDRSGDLPGKAADFLVSTQCADGGFPLFFKEDPADCTSHTDSTGLAVQALVAADRDAEAEEALDWLEDEQLDDGGFRDNGFGTPPANSNSTALAVQGLTAGGRVTAAAEGVAWLRTVQVGCDAPADDRGAVGYDKPVVNGMALRATAQVVPALAGKSLGKVDGTGSAPGLEPVDCTPDDDSSGGTGDSGGSQGSQGGDSGGSQGSQGGDSGGDTSGGDASGGTDPTPSPSPGDTSGQTAAGGDSGTGTSGSGSGSSGSGGLTPDAGSPDGSLATTGSSSLLLGAGAAALLLTGGAVLLLARMRRRSL